MPGSWAAAAAGVGIAVVALWLVLVAALALARPDQLRMTDVLRLLPDLVRMLRRVAGDHLLPRIVRVRLWLLLAYLASPIDLVPDFIPVIGYADDAIIVAVTLRSVARRCGRDTLRRHWPGTEDGFEAVCRLAGIAPD